MCGLAGRRRGVEGGVGGVEGERGGVKAAVRGGVEGGGVGGGGRRRGGTGRLNSSGNRVTGPAKAGRKSNEARTNTHGTLKAKVAAILRRFHSPG